VGPGPVDQNLKRWGLFGAENRGRRHGALKIERRMASDACDIYGLWSSGGWVPGVRRKDSRPRRGRGPDHLGGSLHSGNRESRATGARQRGRMDEVGELVLNR